MERRRRDRPRWRALTLRWFIPRRPGVSENRIGSGLSNAELGLRLRYEIAREFAPYVGVSYHRKIGDTARFARLAGEDVSGTSFVMGVRFWF